MPLSERQENILKFIGQFSAENGYPPTIREIGAAVDIPSTSVVNYNLNVLKREGYLNRSPDVSRGITLVGDRAIVVPIVGTIAAGEPIPVPDVDFPPFEYETLMLPGDQIKSSENFLLVPRHGKTASNQYTLLGFPETHRL